MADVRLSVADLVYPLFVGDQDQPQPVASMPGVSQMTVTSAVDQIQELTKQGLKQFILFGVTRQEKKNPQGSYAWDASAPVNRVLSAVRDAGLDAVMIADLCLCEYTDHGHCGPLCQDDPGWTVDNDQTLDRLAQAADALAHAGADVVAPSGRMDGQVAAVRAGLDQGGWPQVAILSYTVKYASCFYGPFRDAGGGEMAFGDRRGYQMDYRRTREWRSQLDADIAQGADMVMVKPAGLYLDTVRQVRDACALPVAGYHVSGEYAMLHAGTQQGVLDLKQAVLEVTHGIKRAGADLILTYFAPQLVGWLAG